MSPLFCGGEMADLLYASNFLFLVLGAVVNLPLLSGGGGVALSGEQSMCLAAC
jgi:hypothetical protein